MGQDLSALEKGVEIPVVMWRYAQKSSNVLHLGVYREWVGKEYDECHFAGMFLPSTPHTPGLIVS